MRPIQGTKDLKTGTHHLRVEFFQRTGGAGLILMYEGLDTGNEMIIIPPSVFKRRDEPCCFKIGGYGSGLPPCCLQVRNITDPGQCFSTLAEVGGSVGFNWTRCPRDANEGALWIHANEQAKGPNPADYGDFGPFKDKRSRRSLARRTKKRAKAEKRAKRYWKNYTASQSNVSASSIEESVTTKARICCEVGSPAFKIASLIGVVVISVCLTSAYTSLKERKRLACEVGAEPLQHRSVRDSGTTSGCSGGLFDVPREVLEGDSA
jgi:hypothetical protein